MVFLRQILLCVTVLSSLSSVSHAQSTTIAGATATAASTPSQIAAAPSCARACVQTATGTQSCAPGDQTCLCSFSTQIQESIYKCLGTSACTADEKTTAFEYYPVFCRDLNLAVETSAPTILATAVGGAPTEALSTPSILTSETTQAGTETSNSSGNIHGGLQLPAILGITLVVVVMTTGVASLLIWSYLRRRQMVRGPRMMDLGGELLDSKPRPARSKYVDSDFMVQPPPIEKDTMGARLSRSSTLVPPPPIAKDEKRGLESKRDSARNKALKLLTGYDGLRSSMMSSRSGSKQSSLIVPPLDIRKSQEEQLRISKF